MRIHGLFFLKNPQSQINQKGAALVVTLLVVVLFATIVAGFLAATRLEQTASRNFTYQNVAEQMAQMAAQQAIAQLNRDVATAISNSSAITTMPGAVFNNGNLVVLSSASATGATSNSTNANYISAISGLRFINSNTNSNLFSVPLVDVTNQMHGTNIYGRYAYWIDDDGSRANLNSMIQTSTGNSSSRSNYLPYFPNDVNPRILDASVFSGVASYLRGGILNSFSNENPNNQWSYILTPYQTLTFTGIGTTNSQQMLTQVTAGPANLGNLWNYTNTNFLSRRVNLNQNLRSVPIGSLTLRRNFLTNATGAENLTQEIDRIITEKIDRPQILNRYQSGFQSKYGLDALRQIIVNINDSHFTSSNNSTSSQLPTGYANTNSDGIPNSYLGPSKASHLNEVSARVAYNPRTLVLPDGISVCEVQIWLKFELVNPYSFASGNQSEISFEIDDFSATATYTSSNGTPGSATLSRSTVPALGPQSGRVVVNTSVLPKSYLPDSGTTGTSASGNLTFGLEYQFYQENATHNIPAGATGIAISNVSFLVNNIKLLRMAGNDLTIHDWATAEDFAGHGSANGTLSFNGASVTQVNTSLKQSSGATENFQLPDTGILNFNAGSVLGIAKNDPRVRRFPRWSNPIVAWFPVYGNTDPAVTFGAQNSVVKVEQSGVQGISADRFSGNLSGIWNHPSFSQTSNATNYRSLVDLGSVHTGLQWRTLHMASQNPAETDSRLIPDWALFDTFFLTNNIPTNVVNPLVKMNVNSVHYPAATNTSIPNQATGGLLRNLALQTLLSAGTNTNAATNVGITSGSVMTNSGANSPAAIASNISQLRFNANWNSRRTALGTSNFPPTAYTSIGEVIEIQNVADFSADDHVNEGRAAAFIDAITTHSDIFSIYSIGYAVDRTGATVSEFAIRTQVQFDPDRGQFKIVFSEPLK